MRKGTDILWMRVARNGTCWLADYRLHLMEVVPFGGAFLWTVEHNDDCGDRGGVMGIVVSEMEGQDKAMAACMALSCAPAPIAGIPYRMAAEIADIVTDA